MEEDSKSDATRETGGAGGDASQVFHHAETGSGSDFHKGESNSIQNSLTASAAPNGEGESAPQAVGENESEQIMGENLAGVEDVEMGVKNLEATAVENTDLTSPRGAGEAPATENHRAKLARLNPDVDKHRGEEEEEEDMFLDTNESLLHLDEEIEKGIPTNVESGRVKVSPVLSSSAGPSEGSKVNEDESPSSDGPPARFETPSGSAVCLADSGGEESKAVAPEELPSLSDDMSDSDDDEGAGVINPRLLTARQKGILQRRRLVARRVGRRRPLASSSDSHDDTDSDDNDIDGKDDDKQTGKESDNDEEVLQAIQGVLDKPMPQPNWFALRELRKREYCSAGRVASSWFRQGVQSSLHMVKRLVTVERLKAHEGCVNALAFNRIGTLLASGSDDLDIVLWNWQKARPSVTYESGHRSNVFQAKFMPFSGDCHVISCARDGQVRLAELNSTGVCRATRKLAQHRGAAHKLALEMDSAHVFLSCGEDALTFLFDLRQEKPHKLVTAKENDKKVPLYSIQSNPCNSHQFCVGGRDHYIRVYDKRKISEQADGGVYKKLCPDHLVKSDVTANVTCACYNFDGSEILGTYNDEDIYLFDNTMSDGANYIHKYAGHRNSATVKGVNFYGPKSEFIISGSDCGHVYFWDKETEAIINFQDGDDMGVINALEPHPTLPVLATSGLDHDVKLWMPMLGEPYINWELLKKVMKKNQVERSIERCTTEPEIGGQMLWFIMNHFRNTARRRMREEGQELSTSDEDEDDSHSDSEANPIECAQS